MRSTKIVGVDEKNLSGYGSCMSPEQCRAARAWLELSQTELADAAGVSNSTVRDFEAGRRTPIGNNMSAMSKALEDRGIKLADNGIFGPAK